jgi:hypothetical protein
VCPFGSPDYLEIDKSKIGRGPGRADSGDDLEPYYFCDTASRSRVEEMIREGEQQFLNHGVFSQGVQIPADHRFDADDTFLEALSAGTRIIYHGAYDQEGFIYLKRDL